MAATDKVQARAATRDLPNDTTDSPHSSATMWHFCQARAMSHIWLLAVADTAASVLVGAAVATAVIKAGQAVAGWLP